MAIYPVCGVDIVILLYILYSPYIFIARSPSASFSSLESSHIGHGQAGGDPNSVPRMLARTGEPFKFRVPLQSVGSPSPSGPLKPHPLEARLLSGKPVPKFIKVDFDAFGSSAGSRAQRRIVQFRGIPSKADSGELNIGIYDFESGECVGRAVIEVVERS